MNYISPNFQIEGKRRGNKVYLNQCVLHPAYHTSELPCTLSVLENSIPTIFENKCFNGKNLPFRDEAQNTEVGHLFEHILIENIKLLAVEKYGRADVEGITSWNWNKEKKGTFRIVIKSRELEDEILSLAFARSITVLESIFDLNKKSEESLPRSTS